MIKAQFITLCLLIQGMAFSSSHKEEIPLCSLVEKYWIINFEKTDRYNNGYKEERYHEVLDTVLKEFSQDVVKHGGILKIQRDWTDGAVNAWAWKIGTEYLLEVPGGMARYYLINEEAFLTTICHELGHLLGGAPHRRTISYEGQADYYAPMKCMERLLFALGHTQVPFIEDSFQCEGDFCLERLRGAESLTSYYAELEGVRAPDLSSPSQDVVSTTLVKHPGAQCRFDTMVAALKCSDRTPFSYTSWREGACLESGSRPLCWFNPAK